MVASFRRVIIGGVCAVVFLSAGASANARSFRSSINFMPNAEAIDGRGCVNCHISPFGGGRRNEFGEAVNALVTPGGRQQFWNQLFDVDSDGDGFTNGEEMGDPDGTFSGGSWDQDPRLVAVGNPGLDSSTPVLEAIAVAPVIVSGPAQIATLGLPFSSVQVAEGESLEFTLIDGPEWLSLDPVSGVFSGTPPVDLLGASTVTVRVSNMTNLALFDEETYTVSYQSSYRGWAAAQFGPEATPEVTAPGADPDEDGLINVVEYATMTNPTEPTEAIVGIHQPQITVDDTDRLSVSLGARTDDPSLQIEVDFASDVEFATPRSVVISNLVDLEVLGVANVTANDPELVGETGSGYARIRYRLTLD